MKAVTFNRHEMDTLMDGVFLSNQQRRFIDYVAANPHSFTLAVNKATAIDNISHVARRVNVKLMPLGYFVACVRPLENIADRFGEPIRMYGWSIFELPQRAANESFNDSVLGMSQ